MGKLAGYKVVLQIDSKTIVGYRTHSMDAEADLGDATTGESTNQWKEYLPLYKGMKFSVGGLYDPTAGVESSFDDIYALLAAGTQVTAIYGGETTGDTIWTVSAYINSVHHEGDYTDLQSYTVELTATGEPTKSAVV